MKEPLSFRSIGACPYLCPIPSVVLGCGDEENGNNLITIAWTGIVCSKPPMVSVSIRKNRFSYDMIKKSQRFTLNLINEPLCEAMDFCGVRSGRDVQKFDALDLTPLVDDAHPYAPAIQEAPAYLVCEVVKIEELGSHDLFLANILEVHVAERYFRADGSIDEQAMNLVCYVHGKYCAVGEMIGFFGYSVASDEVRVRRMKEGK